MDFKTAYFNAVHYGIKLKRKPSEEWIDPVMLQDISILDVLAEDWDIEDLEFEPIVAWAVVTKDGSRYVVDNHSLAVDLMQKEESAIMVKLIDERIVEFEGEMPSTLFI